MVLIKGSMAPPVAFLAKKERKKKEKKMGGVGSGERGGRLTNERPRQRPTYVHIFRILKRNLTEGYKTPQQQPQCTLDGTRNAKGSACNASTCSKVRCSTHKATTQLTHASKDTANTVCHPPWSTSMIFGPGPKTQPFLCVYCRLSGSADARPCGSLHKSILSGGKPIKTNLFL